MSELSAELPAYQSQVTPDARQHLMPVPPEMFAHLQGLQGEAFDRSYESTAKMLGAIGLYEPLTLDTIAAAEAASTGVVEVPAGFAGANLIKGGALIRTDSLEKSLQALNNDAQSVEFIEADVLELMTDSGEIIRYCDLRDKMTSSVRKGGAETKQQETRLDKAFFNDVRLFAERGHASNRVAAAPGVYYTKVPDSKLRTYWMLPQDKLADGIKTVVRVADCADSLAKEIALYRQLFGVTMR